MDDDHENMTDPVDQQPREDDSGTDHAVSSLSLLAFSLV